MFKIILFSLLSVTSSFAFADALQCFDYATNTGRNITTEEAVTLCKGTTNTVALYCFDMMASRNLSQIERIMLCKGARDISVISCFDNSANRPRLTINDRIELCSQR